MRYQAGIVKQVIQILLPLLAFCAVTGNPLPCESQESTAKNETPTFGLTGGQVLIGKLEEKELSILTSYGKLTVPFKEIRRVRFSPRLSQEGHETLDEAFERLRKKDPEALDDLREIGPACYRSLLTLRGLEEDETIRKQLSGLIRGIEATDDIYLEAEDEITTQRFTIRGIIEIGTFHITRGAIKLEVPSTDMVYIAWGELDTSKTWKVKSSNIESSNRHLSTGYKLRKGQKFSLESSGTVVWQGRSFGPAGLSNHSWNSRSMGSLQWRVGKQPWQLAGTKSTGRAPASGELQFSIHLTSSGTTSGFFSVKFRSKK
ncbi:MAG: hypothetical protein VYC32_04290 [Planctomycetota bacterium]|nr:hypothetical protein [Planctomycetota bacterium]